MSLSSLSKTTLSALETDISGVFFGSLSGDVVMPGVVGVVIVDVVGVDVVEVVLVVGPFGLRLRHFPYRSQIGCLLRGFCVGVVAGAGVKVGVVGGVVVVMGGGVVVVVVAFWFWSVVVGVGFVFVLFGVVVVVGCPLWWCSR